jgi:hypothetical protein
MSNGDDQQQVNCILEICCGGEGGHKRLHAMVKMLHHDLGDGPYRGPDIATWILQRFDLAEKGTLKPFKDSIAALARGFPYEEE